MKVYSGVLVFAWLSLIKTVVADSSFIFEMHMNYSSLGEKVAPKMKSLTAAYAALPGEDRDVLFQEYASIAFQKYHVMVDLDHIKDRSKLQSPDTFPISSIVRDQNPANIPFSFHRLELSSNKYDIMGRLVEHVRTSIVNARGGLSRLLAHPYVLEISGMSDANVRHLINDVCSVTGTRFVEVGSYRGSTAASAIAGNDATVDFATAIDFWEQFIQGKCLDCGTQEEEIQIFKNNIAKTDFPMTKFNVVQKDFRAVELADFMQPGSQVFTPFNVYLFDGPHEEIDQFDAIKVMLPFLANEFVLMVDDFNWLRVREGTYRAIKEFNLKVHFSEWLGNGGIKDHIGIWRNGFFIAVISK